MFHYVISLNTIFISSRVQLHNCARVKNDLLLIQNVIAKCNLFYKHEKGYESYHTNQHTVATVEPYN